MPRPPHRLADSRPGRREHLCHGRHALVLAALIGLAATIGCEPTRTRARPAAGPDIRIGQAWQTVPEAIQYDGDNPRTRQVGKATRLVYLDDDDQVAAILVYDDNMTELTIAGESLPELIAIQDAYPATVSESDFDHMSAEEKDTYAATTLARVTTFRSRQLATPNDVLPSGVRRHTWVRLTSEVAGWPFRNAVNTPAATINGHDTPWATFSQDARRGAVRGTVVIRGRS